MLFMGTDKYQDENYYQEFLNNNGGNYNAYTAGEFTNYFFDIQNNYFLDALDIFSQFFISPLMNKNSVDREMNAVDSEHNKNINNDFRREYMILKTISNKEYPFSKFGTGNLET